MRLATGEFELISAREREGERRGVGVCVWGWGGGGGETGRERGMLMEMIIKILLQTE